MSDVDEIEWTGQNLDEVVAWLEAHDFETEGVWVTNGDDLRIPQTDGKEKPVLPGSILRVAVDGKLLVFTG